MRYNCQIKCGYVCAFSNYGFDLKCRIVYCFNLFSVFFPDYMIIFADINMGFRWKSHLVCLYVILVLFLLQPSITLKIWSMHHIHLHIMSGERKNNQKRHKREEKYESVSHLFTWTWNDFVICIYVRIESHIFFAVFTS